MKGFLTNWSIRKRLLLAFLGVYQLEPSAADRQLVAGILSKPTTPESLLELIVTCRGTPRGT